MLCVPALSCFPQNGAGPDKGKGGKYLVLPPGYDGDVPDGYFVVRSKTYRVWNFTRGYLDHGYRGRGEELSRTTWRCTRSPRQNAPPAMEFINASGLEGINTVVPNDYSFYEALNALDPGMSRSVSSIPRSIGLIAAIGIVKGKPFSPDERMKAILTDAVAIGNATAAGDHLLPARPGPAHLSRQRRRLAQRLRRQEPVLPPRRRPRARCAAPGIHYNCIVVSPAMAVTTSGQGVGLHDRDARFRAPRAGRFARPTGSTCRPTSPVKDFWAVTIYDTQTRSQLQTDQQFPTVGSQDEGIRAEPRWLLRRLLRSRRHRRAGKDNWLQTIPGQELVHRPRMYGPLDSPGSTRPGGRARSSWSSSEN